MNGRARHPVVIVSAVVCVGILVVAAFLRRGDKVDAGSELTPSASVSASPTPTVSITPDAAAPSEEHLMGALLTPSDLPTGFTILASDSQSAGGSSSGVRSGDADERQSDNPQCTDLFHAIGSANEPVREVTRRFGTTQTGPSLAQTVAVFAEVNGVSAGLQAFERLRDECSTTWTETDVSSAITYTVTGFTIPTYATATVALHISTVSQDFRYNTVMVAIQHERYATLLAFSSPLQLESGDVEPVAARAGENLMTL